MSEFKPLVDKSPFSKEFRDVLNRVSRPLFTQKDTPFSPRMLNYYDGKELLLFASEKGKKRLLTGEQLFWLYILHDTAKLGYTLIENLQAIKYKFENTDVVDGNYDKYHFLQYILAFIIQNQMEHHLKIDEDGSYSFFTYHNFQRVIHGDFVTRVSHVDIALGPIAQKIWKTLTGQDLVFKKPSLEKLSYTNQELMERLGRNDFERIEIVKKGDGTNEINIIERDKDPSRYDLNRAVSLMKNGKLVISYGTEPGKALSVIKEKRIKGQK